MVRCGRDMWGRLTPSNSSLSSRCRGMTVTSSISQRKAISAGTRPGGSGRAMVRVRVEASLGGVEDGKRVFTWFNEELDFIHYDPCMLF